MNNQKLLVRVVPLLLLIGALIVSYFVWYSPWRFTEDRLIRVLHVDSYHAGYGWSDGQLEGFVDAFEKAEVDIEIQRIEIDSERNKTENFLEAQANKAKKVVESFAPDLLFVTDDKAQEYFGRYYAGTDIPLVYSGIIHPEDYGYHTADNVAGVLEIYPFAKGIEFFKTVFPATKKVVLITNPTPTGMGLFEIAKDQSKEFPNMIFEFKTAETFKEYQELILLSQDADCLIEIPLMNFRNEYGEIVSTEEVQKWTVDNNRVPELTYWDVLGYDGVFLNYVYSPQWDGELAGKIAIQILLESKTPASFAGEVVNRGKKIINLRRAETLGINKEDILSTILINSEVVETLPWE